jgi:hypothetical protein
VLRLDDRGVGTFVRRDDATPLNEREVRLRYRTRNGRMRLATDAWFFEEGRAGETPRRASASSAWTRAATRCSLRCAMRSSTD